MEPYVLFFDQLDRASLPLVGGKGANLGELTKAGFPVPGGFCVTTHAYREFIAASPAMESYLAALNGMDPADLDRLRELGERIRAHLEQLPIPPPIAAEIVRAWTKLGPEAAYAVRSSATAEDLPNASFAGQQDTYLNIKGREPLLAHVRRCWASLFTDRAIAYRAKNGFVHRAVYLSIVVQLMVIPEISGIMFTADPVSGNRTVVAIDAGFGLGEALVSGLVSADLYQVKNNGIILQKVSQKKLAIQALPDGGTAARELPLAEQGRPALTERQILDLAALGKRIEHHYGAPQDIEFCLAGGEFFIVQSRPITTLYPLPELPPGPIRVLLSFGHAQMMLNAIRPLGLSVLRTVFPDRVMREAGGRIYLDPTDVLHSKLARLIIPKLLANADEAMSRALEAVIRRPEFRAGRRSPISLAVIRQVAAPILKEAWQNLRTRDPKLAKAVVESFMERKIAATRQALSGVQGAARLQAVEAQLRMLLPDLARNILPYLLPGIIAGKLLQRTFRRRPDYAADLNKLNVSLPGNITSQMGLDLGDLADLLRDRPEVQEYLKTAADQTLFTGLAQVPGGSEFQEAFEGFLAKYGRRCPGEIDLTNPRWREAPTQLTAALFSHIRSVKPGEHRQRFAEGGKEAEEAARRILDRIKGKYFRAKLTARLITVFRQLGGLREHPKYLLVTILDECKRAIMAEAGELVRAGRLEQAEDAYFLSLTELIRITRGNFTGNIAELVAERRERYQWQQNLKPPRVMTSEGEIIVVPPLRRNVAAGTLVGSPVSAGVCEGVARVVLRPEKAVLNEGEILVAPHTDPGWTPLFQSARALVTEAGGLMTHGAVVAREYGIPAVVGVDEATTLIKDGERIRVDGDQGLVEVLR